MIVYTREDIASLRPQAERCACSAFQRRRLTDDAWARPGPGSFVCTPISRLALNNSAATHAPPASSPGISAQRPGAGLIHHSDRGVQYASAEYRKLLRSAGFKASMSRRADCYENAPMESFFHTLKTEQVYHTHYATRADAARDIFAYIEGFYNRTRRHSTIGYISPIEMELKAA